MNIKIFNTKTFLSIIFIAYFFYILGIFLIPDYIKGINFIDGYLLGGDSYRYIDGAEKLINSELPTGKSSSYLGYILFISLFKYFELNLNYVVISQILLTILSSICLYKITKKMSSTYGGLFCISLYLFYFPLQIRNFFILTETLYICCIIFLLYFLFFFKKKFIIILIFFIPFILTIRPHGIILVPSLFLAGFFWLYLTKEKKILYLMILTSSIFLYPFISLLNVYLENEKVIYKIINYGIIYGYNSESNYLNFKEQVDNNNDILSLIIFIKENLNNFIISFYKKIWFFLIRIRPFYSDLHNLYLIFFNFIFYPLAIYGFVKTKIKIKFSLIFMCIFVILSTISAGLSFADWSGRFVLYIFPIFFIFAGIGFSLLIKIIALKFQRQ